MNIATLKMALSAATAISERVKEYNEKKTREAYEMLSDAAGRVDLDDLKARGGSLLDESRREAGQVTQAAHARLEAAKKRLEKAADNRPSQKKARATERRRSLTTFALAALTLSAIGGVVYWFTRQQPQPGDTPPRVEDFSGPEEKAPETESTLVYSTTSPEEGVPEQIDEELMQSLDDQLEKHLAAAMDEAGVTEEPEEAVNADADIAAGDAAPAKETEAEDEGEDKSSAKK